MKLDSSAWRVFMAAGLALSTATAFAQANPGVLTVRPPGYQPLQGDPNEGKALFNDTKLSTNGAACATCHANHGAFTASFAQPYPPHSGHGARPAWP